MEGMAAQDALGGEPEPLAKPVALERYDRVLATRRNVPARRRGQRGNELSVEVHKLQREVAGEILYEFAALVHLYLVMLLVSSLHSSIRSSGEHSASLALLAINATSYPGQGPPVCRTASLITRLHLFLKTALPKRFPAIKATRPDRSRPSGVFAIRAITILPKVRFPCLKSLSMSSCDLTVPCTGRIPSY